MIYDPNMSTGSLYNCNDVSVSQPSTGTVDVIFDNYI